MFKLFNITSDSYIRSVEPTRNFGRSEQLYVNSASMDRLGVVSLDETSEDRTLISFNSDELIAYMGGIEHIDEYIPTLELFISDFSIMSKEFFVYAHPLSSSFDEGLGNDGGIFTTGVTWEHYQTGLDWVNEGGDYLDLFTLTGSIDEARGVLSFDLSEYLVHYADGSIDDNGLLLKTSNATYNFAMYSKTSNFGLHPHIIITNDNYTVDDSVQLYTSSIRPYIQSKNYKSLLHPDEYFSATLLIEEFYKRPSFSSGSIKYLPEMQYKIVDHGRDAIIVDYSDNMKIPVTSEGAHIQFSTENFPEGSYYVIAKYESETEVHYSDKMYFRLEK